MRKVLDSGKQKQRCIMLPDKLAEKARLIGAGSLSVGIRKALVRFQFENRKELEALEQVAALRARGEV